MTDRPKKPNKIVIPDGPAPEWAMKRWDAIVRQSGFDALRSACHLVSMIEEEPIDEDLIEARKICAVIAGRNELSVAKEYTAGSMDNVPLMVIALAAIKRGRELGKAGDQDHD